jgi:hypothetical protein
LPGILEKGPPLGSLGKWGVRLASWLSSGVRSDHEARAMSPIGTAYASGIGPRRNRLNRGMVRMVHRRQTANEHSLRLDRPAELAAAAQPGRRDHGQRSAASRAFASATARSACRTSSAEIALASASARSSFSSASRTVTISAS